jgi:broad specificity phosphatase PhoE
MRNPFGGNLHSPPQPFAVLLYYGSHILALGDDPMLFTLVRHGECLGQTDPQFWSDPDSALSTRGIEQAIATAHQLATEQVTHLVSSPLLRALTTADAIATMCAIAHIQVWPKLREGFSGTYRGLARSKLLAQFPRAVLADSITEDGWNHGDTNYDALWLRCQELVQRVRQQFTHQNHVVLVTHGGCANYLLHILLGIDRRSPQWFELANGSISRVRLVPDPQAERPDWPLYPPIPVEIKTINDIAHLACLAPGEAKSEA